MKKFSILMGFVTSSLLLMNSCSEPLETKTERGGTFSLIAICDNPTKTSSDGASTSWSAGDGLNVFHAEAGTAAYGSNDKFTIAEEDLSEGRFTATSLADGTLDPAKSYDWYALYPYNSNIATPANTSYGFLSVGSSGKNVAQKQNGNDSKAHLAGKYFPLYAKAADVPASTSPTFTMHQALSVIKIHVTNTVAAPLTVTDVKFTAPEEIVGTYYIDFSGETPSFTGSGEDYVSSTATLSVTDGTEIAKDEAADFYIAIKPFTATSGSDLKLSVNGYEKTITLTKEASFTSGKIKTINFNYDKVESDYTGTYVILAKDGDNYYAMTDTLVSNKYLQNYVYSYDGTSADLSETNAALLWKVTKCDDKYTISCPSDNKYLSTNSGSSKCTLSESVTDDCKHTINNISDRVFNVTNTNGDTYYLRYNTSSPRFTFYASTSTGTGDLYFIPVTKTIICPIPNPDGIESTGGDYSVPYIIINPVDGKSVTASSQETWVNSFDYTNDGKISFKVDANTTSTARSSVVTVSYEGADDVTFTVTQASAGAKTYTMTIDSSNNGDNNVHWTATSTATLTFNNITWSTSVVGTSSLTINKTQVQIGSKGNPATKVTLSTTGFGGKKIISASLTGFCMTNTGPVLTIEAGSTKILESKALVKSTSTEYTSTNIDSVTLGTSDALTFTISSSAKAAIVISQITVVYED